MRASVAVTGLAGAGILGAPAQAGRRFSGADEFDAAVPLAWFDLASGLVERTPGYSPPVTARAFGYAGLALYEALLPGMNGYRSLLPGMPAAGRNAVYDWPLVANAALAEILRSLFPTAPPAQQSASAALEKRLGERNDLPPGVRARSQQRGYEVARAVFAWSKTDGGHEGYLHNFPPYDAPVGPGYWTPTPPGYLPGLQPYWGSNRCLAVSDGAACPPDGHPPFSEDPASAFYAEAIETYETVNRLTPEQEEIARFWSDDPGTTATPPGHSIAITSQVLELEDANLATAAETYARVGIGVCDAFICCWYEKYVDNLIRPVSYLQRLVDPDWLPMLITPPFPEYPSGHSVQSGAAFQILTALFGDGYRFTDHTHDDRGLAPRSFDSFLRAAQEAAVSRLYGGIHYRSAIADGLAAGTCIGEAVAALPLRG